MPKVAKSAIWSPLQPLPPALVISNLSPSSEHHSPGCASEAYTVKALASWLGKHPGFQTQLQLPHFSHKLYQGDFAWSLSVHKSWQWLKTSAEVHVPPGTAFCSPKSVSTLPRYFAGWNGTCIEETKCPHRPGTEKYLRIRTSTAKSWKVPRKPGQPVPTYLAFTNVISLDPQHNPGTEPIWQTRKLNHRDIQ